MRTRDIMTENPECVTPDQPVSRAAQLMRDADVGIIPVVDNGTDRRLRGVITDRDIAVRHVAERHSDDCRVSSHMSEGVATVGPEADVDEVLRVMADQQVRRVPVVENDRLVGIVAQADIAVDVGPEEPRKVERTIEKISLPAEPQR